MTAGHELVVADRDDERCCTTWRCVSCGYWAVQKVYLDDFGGTVSRPVVLAAGDEAADHSGTFALGRDLVLRGQPAVVVIIAAELAAQAGEQPEVTSDRDRGGETR